MNTTNTDDFMSRLLDTFRGEAEEHYKAIVAGLLALEQAPSPDEQAPLLEATFREAHSLKGAARAVGQIDIEGVCQSLEGVFARLKRGELPLSAAVLDPLHRALNTVEALLSNPAGRHATQVAEAVDELVLLEAYGTELTSGPDGTDSDDFKDIDDFGDFGDFEDSADFGDFGAFAASDDFGDFGDLDAFAASDDLPEAASPMTPRPASQPGPPADFLDKLLAAFRVEADEHLKASVAGLLDLEQLSTAADQAPVLETIFREAHSLKGAARSVNLSDLETVCTALEDVFAHLKRGALSLSPTIFDTLHRSLDTVQALLTSADADKHASQVTEAVTALSDIALTAKGAQPAGQVPVGLRPAASPFTNGSDAPARPLTNGSAHPAPQANRPGPAASAGPVRLATAETIRVSTAKLDSLLLQAEEMLGAKQMVGERGIQLRAALSSLTQWKKEWTKTSPEARKVQRIFEDSSAAQRRQHSHLPLAAKLVEFLYWSEHELSVLESQLKALTRATEQELKETGSLVTNLLDDTKKVLMLPFLSLLDVFPKMVRDLSRSLGKDVDLTMRGSEVEIDKRILEELKDPLIHLLRNSVDHGFELPAVRAQQGKPVRGALTLSIAQVSASTVEVLLTDDGAGIDPAAVKRAAVQRGVLAAQEAERLNEQEALGLIFQSDVSTSQVVTDLSGRGLGMAIVREKVEKLGGQVSIDTRLGQGTTFRILLPLTLATFRGITVQAAGQTFVIPTANVERAVRIRRDEIKTVEGEATFLLQGRPVAVTHLEAVLRLPRKDKAEAETGFQTALVLGANEKRMAFCVDTILNEQEALFKNLGSYLSNVRNVAGATVLGSGKVVAILQVPDLLQSVLEGTATTLSLSAPVGGKAAGPQSVLVAEDSVTSRMLLKGILESAGYQVTTAIDGLDAFTLLKRGNFDLVVSDVEMPHMNGFELTAQIRADEQYGQVPVVLVTGLESDEDRERGSQAGANSYLVKGSFDHSNLLEAVQRLL